MPVQPQPRPGPFLAIWVIALLIIAALTAAVVRYLSLPADHAAMGMGSSDSPSSTALTRLRSGEPLHGLLGSALVTQWQLNAVAVAFVVLLAGWYLTRLVQARRRGASWPLTRLAAFAAGLALCILATCGSIGVYDQVLFSAHMLGHLAFVMAAPALLMAGRPLELALLARDPVRRARLEAVYQGRVVSLLTAPPIALASYAVVIAGSHLTGLMNTIMANSWAGQVEHLVYLVIGCQFFMLVLGDAPIRWQLSTPARWLLLAVAMAVDTFVGLILMQGNQPIHMVSVPGLSVNTLSDTHTGGSIMWFGGDGIMAAIMIALVIGWLRDPDRQRQDNSGWLEQARRATFAERTGHTGTDTATDLNFDEEDERLTAYNAWLSQLQHGESSGPRPGA